MGTRVLVIGCLALLSAARPLYARQVVDGTDGQAALYRLVKPPSWNGSLVLYAHGYVPLDAPIALPPEGELIAGLLAPQGFAVAFSSYGENGWAVKDGARHTRRLLSIFMRTFGTPRRVYVVGASMGGLIAIELAETRPDLFDAALPACAAAGGARH